MPKNCYTWKNLHSIGESYGFSLTVVTDHNYKPNYVRIDRVWPFFYYCRILRVNVIKENSKFSLEIDLPPKVDSLEELLTSVIMEKTFNE
jgi:hypothetical protein